ncbi:hypothetical protein M422DRAFT_172686 [Sphaerobolus stellatus SS14]|uniref:Integrase core domain-containing protein n=1 Tax=Sphaerobolus stellatus (strain SS14) TaxID=990650 RepID=A0A0C9VHY9_SPHS4|nr:hypothetical protein M422DRAFT_172686 [Sphaerobolus stellatus SS14]
MELLPDTLKKQLVLDQLAKDPLMQKGPDTIKEAIRQATGYDLTCVLVSIGPHKEWSGDGHDKLTPIRLSIYDIRDKWSGKWLRIWVIPNNHLADVVAYVWLTVIEEPRGMPIQSTTDCGSETTQIYGIVNALQELLQLELPLDEIPAHRFLKSVHNIMIERGWHRLHIQWGDTVAYEWNMGIISGIYNPDLPHHVDLATWLWSTLIQEKLDELKEEFNTHKICYDSKKVLPSGVSPNVAMALYEDWPHVEYCLQPVDVNLIRKLKELIGGKDLVRFVSEGFATHCEGIFENLGFSEITFQNVWNVFSQMLPLLFEENE